MDCTVHGDPKSWTQLTNFHSHSFTLFSFTLTQLFCEEEIFFTPLYEETETHRDSLKFS